MVRFCNSAYINFYCADVCYWGVSDNRIRHIPVVDNKEMKGMVSIGDVVRAVVDEHREELQRLSSYIQGGY